MQFPPEKLVNVRLDHIIDPTLLRALGIIKSEDEIEHCAIDGRQLITLMIKLKQKDRKGHVVVHG